MVIHRSSEADHAFDLFRNLVEQRSLLGINTPRLTEADTRAKLIDPLFCNVLGWSEAEIRRETRLTVGYADYVLGLDAAYLLVEAKRTKPRFQLQVQSKARVLKLSGPHLLSNKIMVAPLEQAQRYAANLGAQVTVLTNGDQFIIFRPYLPGRSWTTGIALAFHDHDDITQDFAFFFRLLSRQSVVSGTLLDEFEQSEGFVESLYTPIAFVHNPDQELVRNPFWAKISRLLSPLLTDQAEDLVSQADTIRNCYVTTPLSDQADESLGRLLQDLPSKALKEAGVQHADSSKRGEFAYRFERDIESSRPGTYILTGGVGSGKTTFLRRFAMVVDPLFIARYCVWTHIDFLTLGDVDVADMDGAIHRFVYQQIRSQLESEHPDKVPQDGAGMRALFQSQLDTAERTRLYGLPSESTERANIEGEIVDKLFNSDVDFASAVLGRVSRRGLRSVVVLDNTDQLGEKFQERVFLFAHKLSQVHKALCIVALREEKFFAAFRRGIFDAFGDRRFHIGSPELKWVLKSRLNYGLNKLKAGGAVDMKQAELEQVAKLLATMIRSVTDRNANIVRMLACVSNGDMRHALDMFRQFVSSGNTDVAKIVGRSGKYIVPFHEFAKSAILGSRRYYRSGRAHIVNVFKKSAVRRASHLAALRILARLDRAADSPSVHGEGFLKTVMLLREYRESFGHAGDFEEAAGELVRRGLVESEPPRMMEITQSIALRLSASGSYYWRYLVRAFAYIDVIWIDVPVADRELAQRLGGMADSTDLVVRFERVRSFLDYIERMEREELAEVARRSGAYRDALVPVVREQIEKEIDVIAKKTGVKDRFRRSKSRSN